MHHLYILPPVSSLTPSLGSWRDSAEVGCIIQRRWGCSSGSARHGQYCYVAGFPILKHPKIQGSVRQAMEQQCVNPGLIDLRMGRRGVTSKSEGLPLICKINQRFVNPVYPISCGSFWRPFKPTQSSGAWPVAGSRRGAPLLWRPVAA